MLLLPSCPVTSVGKGYELLDIGLMSAVVGRTDGIQERAQRAGRRAARRPQTTPHFRAPYFHSLFFRPPRPPRSLAVTRGTCADVRLQLGCAGSSVAVVDDVLT